MKSQHGIRPYYRIADCRQQRIIKRTLTLKGARRSAYGSWGYDYVIIDRAGNEMPEYR